ncbi:MAG: peptidyl-prolyl cis-trans isomerase, partial [Hydrogenobacter sp.]
LGLVPEEYEDYIRRMLTIQKLLALIFNGVYISDKEKEINLAVQSTLLSGRLYILTPSDMELSYTPTQEEMLSFYEKNKELFKKPETKIIRVWKEKDKGKIEELYKSIKEGKILQGYAEYVLPNDQSKLPEVINSEVQRLSEKNRISVSKSGDEYVLIYLYKIEPSGVKSFDEVKDQIKSILIERKKLSALKEKAQEVYKLLSEGKEVSTKYLSFSDTPANQIVNIAKIRQDEIVRFLLSKEKVFGPYELAQGYGVFFITDRKRKVMKEDEAKKLTQDILNMKSDTMVNYLIEHLMKKSKIKVNEEVIKGGI